MGINKKLNFGIHFLNPGSTFQHYDRSLEIFECGEIEKFFIDRNPKEIFYSNDKGSFVITSKRGIKKANKSINV